MEEVKAETPTDAEVPLPVKPPSLEGMPKSPVALLKKAAAGAELRESSSFPSEKDAPDLSKPKPALVTRDNSALLRAQNQREALEALAQSETDNAAKGNTAVASKPVEEADGNSRKEQPPLEEDKEEHKALQQEARVAGLSGSGSVGSVPLEAPMASAGSLGLVAVGEAAAPILMGEGGGGAQRSGGSRTSSLRESMNNPLVERDQRKASLMH
jgi:hypothetical protein